MHRRNGAAPESALSDAAEGLPYCVAAGMAAGGRFLRTTRHISASIVQAQFKSYREHW